MQFPHCWRNSAPLSHASPLWRVLNLAGFFLGAGIWNLEPDAGKQKYWDLFFSYVLHYFHQVLDTLEVRDSEGFSSRDIKRIREQLEMRKEKLLGKWKEIHGKD